MTRKQTTTADTSHQGAFSECLPVFLDENYQPKFVAPLDEVPKRDDWEWFKRWVDDFYFRVSDKAIEDFNNESSSISSDRVATPDTPKPRKKTHGFVYLVNEVNGEHYKIGRSKDVTNRMKIFSVKLPYKIDLIHVIESDDYVKCEENLHRLYENKRVDGEWFALTEDDIAFICGIKEFNEGEWIK